MQATKRFSRDMWKRQFIVTFHGEEGILKSALVEKLNEINKYIGLFLCSYIFIGIDLGGVSREFFTCLCEVLFRGNNPRGLFAPFKDDPQALVNN